MSSFLQLPGSLPWWLVLIAIIPLGLYGLMFLAIPFSVFGVKGRLEGIEARLDDLHADIRSIALLQSTQRSTGFAVDDEALDPSPPPIAPARGGARMPAEQESKTARRPLPSAAARAEPRLNWPK